MSLTQKNGAGSGKIERDLIILLLHSAKKGGFSQEDANLRRVAPGSLRTKLLSTLQEKGLLYLKDRLIEMDSLQRIKLAVRGFELGADLESVSQLLEWDEFERITSWGFEQYGYTTTANVRFKHANRRWEIDVVGCHRPLVVCVDCKHWRRSLTVSAARRVAEQQTVRTFEFSESLPCPTLRVECASWKKVTFVPLVVTLIPASVKFHDTVPIVSILELNDFLSYLPVNLRLIKSFMKRTSFRALT